MIEIKVHLLDDTRVYVSFWKSFTLLSIHMPKFISSALRSRPFIY